MVEGGDMGAIQRTDRYMGTKVNATSLNFQSDRFHDVDKLGDVIRSASFSDSR